MIVLDASAALVWLPGAPGAARLSRRLVGPGRSLHGPHLIDLEVAQVLRRYVAARELPVVRAGQALEDFRQIPITRYPHAILLPCTWQLRASVTAYDAACVALAEAVGAPLITADGKLGRSQGHDARIEVREP